MRRVRGAGGLVAAALLALAACGGDGSTELTVVAKQTATAEVVRRELRCAWNGEVVGACGDFAAREDVLLPPPREDPPCPLPGRTWYVEVTGTHRGESVDRTIAPCSEEEARAVRAWLELLAR